MNWDLLIPILYLAGVAWIGLRVGSGTQDARSLFLADRGLGFGVVGTSLFASNVSSTTLIGLAGAAYVTGIAVSAYEWMAALILVFAAIFIVPIYVRTQILTIPDYMERRFDRGARVYVAALMMFLSVIVDTAASLYAGALVLTVFVPGLPLWPTLIGLGVFAGVYTSVGGLKAVMLTDVAQAVVLIVGSLVITYFAFAEYGFDWAGVRAAVPEGHLHLIRPASDTELPWPGLLLGLPILGFYYWTTNQYISQRFLAAKNLDHARWGTVLAAGLKLLPLFIMVLPGAMAIGFLPDLARPDEVFPTMARELLPVGLRGLVIAAVMAAIMSTIDSTLNAASAIAVYDLAQLQKRDLAPKRLLLIARLTTIGFMIVAIGWAPMIARFPGLFAYLQEVFAYAVPPVAAVYLGGIFWRGARRSAAMPTLAIGHVAGLSLFAATKLGWWGLHFTVNAFILAVFSAVVLVIASVGRPREPAPDAGTLWSPSLATVTAGQSVLKDYRLWAALVVVAVAASILVFA